MHKSYILLTFFLLAAHSLKYTLK